MADRVEGGAAGSAEALALTALLLVRHAHAGEREAWAGDDRSRPLSDRGRAQAAALVDVCAPYELAAVASSPAVRCIQTVVPLAAARGLRVREEPLLLEGSDPAATLAWLETELAACSLAACTHGDIVPELLDAVRARGATLPAAVRWPKASVWVLRFSAGRWGATTFLLPRG